MLPDFAIPYWDAAANGKPVEKAFPRSTQPAQWHCPDCGHEWNQRIAIFIDKYPRLLAGKHNALCPACDGQVKQLGVDDFATQAPELAALWSSKNSQPLSAYSRGSAKMGVWACPEGHEWEKRIKDQALQPFCKKCKKAETPQKRKLVDSKLLVRDAAPDLYAELDAVKNMELLGIDIATLTVRGISNLDLYWICPKQHGYSAKFGNRYTLGRGCGKCSGREAIPGETDILTTDPEIVNLYWDYENNQVSPTTVKRASNKEYNWHCPRGHHWPAKPATLTLKKQFCPFCSGKRLLPEQNDLATLCPLALTYWHPTRNGDLRPDMVTAGLRKKAWWQCPDCNYEFEENIFVVNRALNLNGKYCAACSGKIIIINNNDFESQAPKRIPERNLLDEWDYEENDLLPSEVGFNSSYNAGWSCRTCHHKWRTDVYHRTGPDRTGCPQCALGASASKAENEIADWLISLGVQVEQHVRGKLSDRKEIDIWLPEYDLGIEYNGVYWHSDAKYEDKNRHQSKYEAARDTGIRLLQIWEDDWLRKRAVVESLILYRLNISYTGKIFARKTQVKEISKFAAEKFLNKNHIQGFASGSHYVALNFESEIVAVLITKIEPGSSGKRLNIIRYATSTSVPGGFTKLLKYIERTYQPDSFVTFSDNCISNGALYEANGFTADKKLAPDYMYLVGNQRRHKFGYRLARFRDDPNLLWEAGLKERELAALNGMFRVWDAGKIRWVKTIRTPSPPEELQTNQ